MVAGLYVYILPYLSEFSNRWWALRGSVTLRDPASVGDVRHPASGLANRRHGGSHPRPRRRRFEAHKTHA